MGDRPLYGLQPLTEILVEIRRDDDTVSIRIHAEFLSDRKV
jgi:hypothetical protein